jgi:hypothetical protein
MRVTFKLRVTVRHTTRILLDAAPCTKNGCPDENHVHAPFIHASPGPLKVTRTVVVRRTHAGSVWCASAGASDYAASGFDPVGLVMPFKRVCPRGRM